MPYEYVDADIPGIRPTLEAMYVIDDFELDSKKLNAGLKSMEPNDKERLCWICQVNPAETGEHIIKNSIIKHVLGSVSPDDPKLLHKYDGRKNIPIKGTRNKHFKFEKSLCAKCNEDHTQDHDYAFDKTIKKLLSSEKICTLREKVSISSITGVDKDTKRNFELYLCKLFGCILVDQGVQGAERTLSSLRWSINNGTTAIKGLHLSFFRDVEKMSQLGRPMLGQQMIFDGTGIVFLCSLDWVCFALSYPTAIANEDLFGQPWEIGSNNKTIKLGKILKLSNAK